MIEKEIKGIEELKPHLDKFLKENKINVDYNDLEFGLPAIITNIVKSFDNEPFSTGL
jgi:hypothetical protein